MFAGSRLFVATSDCQSVVLYGLVRVDPYRNGGLAQFVDSGPLSLALLCRLWSSVHYDSAGQRLSSLPILLFQEMLRFRCLS